ncbi:MAG: DNA polymerase III subunit gamma/tau [Myxococcota bacterium]|nr:DNA polymerase III subunit gamma/tau [Myxococcota bacterium]MDW8361814.1 DNA polymerase III subunit gamma/tau [Myxococcales bacterium]
MSYTVLARKYRPQRFEDLVGQEHVSRTLAGAIRTGRIAHAFLFTGARGVGKTTSARLLAKALNCAASPGPTPTPCNDCDPCREIALGSDIDVVELDAASHTGVDDVRRLQETIPFLPARDRFKVLIVDEAHMLSTAAFNALLKTLEEPPAHVKFILATTEPHKIPVTVRSRCQRYDFRLIPAATVAARLGEILAAESIEAEPAAMAVVAREAAGSMRDALTLLDQVVAVADGPLTADRVERVLGIAGRELVHRTLEATVLGEPLAALEAVDELVRAGHDPLHFVRQLAALCRDVVVLRLAGERTTPLVELSEVETQRARALAARCELHELERVFAQLSVLVEDVGRSSVPRTVLEMGLVRIATRPALRDLAELIARFDDAPTASTSTAARAAAAPATRAREATTSAPGARSGSSRAPVRGLVAPSSGGSVAPGVETRRAVGAASRDETGGRGGRAASDAATPRVSAQPDGRSAASVPRREGGALAMTTADAWARIVAAVEERQPAVAAVLVDASPLVVEPGRLVIAFAPQAEFQLELASRADSRRLIAAAAAQVLGSEPNVEIEITKHRGAAPPSLSEVEQAERRARREARRREALEHPRVADARELFPDATLEVDVDDG